MFRPVKPQNWIPRTIFVHLHMLEAACIPAILGLVLGGMHGIHRCPAWLVPGPVTGWQSRREPSLLPRLCLLLPPWSSSPTRRDFFPADADLWSPTFH